MLQRLGLKLIFPFCFLCLSYILASVPHIRGLTQIIPHLPSLFLPSTHTEGEYSAVWASFSGCWSSLYFIGSMCGSTDIPWLNASESHRRSNYCSKRINVPTISEPSFSLHRNCITVFDFRFSFQVLSFIINLMNADNLSSKHVWVSWLHFTLSSRRSVSSSVGRTQRNTFDKSILLMGWKCLAVAYKRFLSDSLE